MLMLKMQIIQVEQWYAFMSISITKSFPISNKWLIFYPKPTYNDLYT